MSTTRAQRPDVPAPTAPQTSDTPGPLARARRPEGFRPDVEGLRAIAVLAVLAYHLNPRWASGGFAGVDMFFVISGFLITSHLVGEVERTGRLSLRRFWGRRILRLLPASTLVLVVTAVGCALVVPRYLWRQFGADGLFAGTYSLNWRLAARSVDYLAEDSVPPPLQHFWSLAVEEQFYLVWPLVALAVAVAAGRRRWRYRPLLFGVTAVAAAGSFAYALARTAVGDTAAYFVTTTRIWELAVGVLTALGLGWWRRVMPARVRPYLVGAGIGCLVLSVVGLDATAWPRWPALLPTVGVALVIAAGGHAAPAPLERLLGSRPLVWVGGLSYSVYLWHWPLITLGHYRWLTFGLPQYAAVVVATFVLAWLSQRLVENPIRFAAWFKVAAWRPFALAGACMALSLAVSAALVLVAPGGGSLTPPPGAQPRGARELAARIDLTDHVVWTDGVEWVLPAPVAALDDVPEAYAQGCQQSVAKSAAHSCSYGDPQASRVVAVVGDSKALQWLPAVQLWAAERGVRIVTYTKSACPLADVGVDLDGSPYSSCREWYPAVMEALTTLRPDLVLTSQVRGVGGATASIGTTPAAAMVAGMDRTWSALAQAGVPVAVLADTPQPGTSIYACVAERTDQLARCEYDRAPAVAASAQPAQLAAVEALRGRVWDASGTLVRTGRNPRVTMLDLTDAVCPDARRCPPVVGNTLIYRSGSHLTKTYVESLAPRLGRLLDKTLVAG